jgi:hypothetical protein
MNAFLGVGQGPKTLLAIGIDYYYSVIREVRAVEQKTQRVAIYLFGRSPFAARQTSE